jgi:hypothetical protein
MTVRRPAALATPLAATLAAVLALAACTDRGGPVAAPTTPAPVTSVTPSATTPPPTTPPASPTASATPVPTPPPDACPTAYAAPDPKRPVVTLRLKVADDKSRVTGTERVVFTPDRPIGRLVFRLWGNGPRSRQGGGHTEVSTIRVDGRAARFTLSASNTLVDVPLPRTVPAGTAVTADLAFSFTLPRGVSERFGHSGGTAWFGSGFPLLAWQRGRGWGTEPPTSAFAEATVSEAFKLDLGIDTAPEDEVLGTGKPVGAKGRVRYRAAEAVRDVLVAVGPFRVAKGRAGGVPVTVGVTPGLRDGPVALLAKHQSAIAAMAARFGPFPYESLDVAVVPDIRGGIEFPGGILLGSSQDQDATLVHEVAHEWFYGLVGNNQGRDPWLDEAFATYAEGLVNGSAGRYLSTSIPAAGRNRVGAPMTFWESRTSAYYRSVYVQGAAALLRARSATGAAAFDRAIRCYVARNAHRVATPRDLLDALGRHRAAVAELRKVGALTAT